MARHVLVTLADERFLDPARQLFACAHFNAGWDGDLLLLAHDVPDAKLQPFRERGIQVRECRPWLEVDRDDVFHPPTVLSKFDVFGTEFRRWQNVVFLDSDIMLWASIHALSRVPGFSAVCERRPLAGQYAERERDPQRAHELEDRYRLERPAFNSGLLAFPSAVIRDDSVERLRGLYLRYRDLQAHPFGDQPALNLYFRGRWTLLPDFYAAIRDHSARHFFLPEERLRMIGKHFAGWPRPWDEESPYHAAWLENLTRFEGLDARRPQAPRARWSRAEVQRYWLALRARRSLGLAGAAARDAAAALRSTPAGKRVRHALRRVRERLGGGGP